MLGEAESIRVLCRVRPCVTEEERCSKQCVYFGADGKSLTVRAEHENIPFQFDRVFSPYATQEDLYEEGVAPLLDAVLKGINGAVIAYGQTGSGKTHTMMGSPEGPEDEQGLTPRLIRGLFDLIHQFEQPDEETFVSGTYVQIYRERIQDLIAGGKHAPECDIQENRNLGQWVTNATDIPLQSWDDALRLIREGDTKRVVGATKMNEVSSRSHSVFIVSVCRRNLTDRTEKAAQLYLCDLAGSESVDKTGSEGLRLEEAKTINTSLLALRKVIDAIVGKAPHVPYRDSKLTRILQNSFGGNARTCLVVCASPSEYNARETLSSVRFGVNTRSIMNCPRENVHRSVNELERLIRETNEQISQAKAHVKHLQRELRRRSTLEDGGAAADSPPPDGDLGSPRDRLVSDDMPRAESYGLVRCRSSGDGPPPGVPEEFLCPLSGQVMVTPVCCASGITYECHALERFMERNSGHLPGQPSWAEDIAVLIPNLSLQAQIASFLPPE
eukprot:TRINITY_DN430_c0_g1_i1.p1 TRINITY_DN430_c0_g1~~TRINITY_DN430_c0_g1_i1.p1  ORF type:complete len:526 (+),score=154.58 TRINITY_DN430_c0_g1_i1:80-1579(+)